MATSWLIKSEPRPRGRWMTWLEAHHAVALRGAMRRWWIAPVAGLLVTGSAVWPFLKVDKSFGGTHTEPFVQVSYEFSEELSLERKEAIVTQVEKALEPHRAELQARYTALTGKEPDR